MDNMLPLQSFASAHGYRFDAVGSIDRSVGNIFSVGINKRATNVVTYTENNENWRCFNYRYTIYSGHSGYDCRFTVLEYDLMMQLPDLAIVSAKLDDFEGSSQDGLGGGAGVPTGYQRLSLEGNFDQKYHAYIIAGSQDGVLEILTPNVMEFLLDTPHNYHVEMTGTRFILSQDEFAKNTDELEGMLDFAHALADMISPTAGRMHYDGAQAASVLSDTNEREFAKYKITIGAIVLIGGALIFAALWWISSGSRN